MSMDEENLKNFLYFGGRFQHVHFLFLFFSHVRVYSLKKKFSRVGAATFITQMGIICPNELGIISAKILFSLPSLFEDISSAVRSAAIDAAAHVAR